MLCCMILLQKDESNLTAALGEETTPPQINDGSDKV